MDVLDGVPVEVEDDEQLIEIPPGHYYVDESGQYFPVQQPLKVEAEDVSSSVKKRFLENDA